MQWIVQHITWTLAMPVAPSIHINIAMHATDPSQLAEAILLSFATAADANDASRKIERWPEGHRVPEENLAVFQQKVLPGAASAECGIGVRSPELLPALQFGLVARQQMEL